MRGSQIAASAAVAITVSSLSLCAVAHATVGDGKIETRIVSQQDLLAQQRQFIFEGHRNCHYLSGWYLCGYSLPHGMRWSR
jgi:hypothetical protein